MRIKDWKLICREDGNVLILSAFSLTVLLGVAGMAIDVGNIYAHKRTMQSAADAAALAGAREEVISSALVANAASAAASQHDTSLSPTTVAVDGFAGATTNGYETEYVKATVTENVPVYFINTFQALIGASNSRTIPVSATSYASYKVKTGTAAPCMTQLSTTGTAVPYGMNGASVNTDLGVSGGGSVTTTNCGVCGNGSFSSSSSPYQAPVAVGSGTLNTVSIQSPGGMAYEGTSGVTVNGSAVTSSNPWSPPFLTSSSSITTTSGGCTDTVASSIPAASNITPASGCADPSWMTGAVSAGGATKSLSPGTYCTFNTANVGELDLAPGVYYVTKSFATDSGTKIVGTGVTFIIDTGSSSSSLTFANGTNTSISAPTTGTWAGILFYDTNTGSPDTFVFQGGSSSSMTGAIYMPDTNVVFNNNSHNTLSGSLTDNTTQVDGGGALTVNYNSSTPGAVTNTGGTPVAGGVALAQ